MRFFIALILLFVCSVCDAQIKDTVLSVENYNSYIRQKARNLNFLEADKAVIQHHEELKSFFRKLSLLKTQNKGTVNIVHLGDSHIQAGYFSGIVRRGLQQYFGNAEGVWFFRIVWQSQMALMIMFRSHPISGRATAM